MHLIKSFNFIILILYLFGGSNVSVDSCHFQCKCESDSVECTGSVHLYPNFITSNDTHYITFHTFEIEDIPTGAFSNLNQIRLIEFKNGAVGHIRSGAFDGMERDVHSSVGSLIISDVTIGTVNSGGLTGVQNFTNLKILNSNFKLLKSEAISHSSFDDIFIFKTAFEVLEPFALGYELQVMTIGFVSVEFGIIPHHFIAGFSDAQEQKYILFKKATLGEISPRAFAGVRNAELYFHECKIDEVSSHAFQGARGIHGLHITETKIGDIKENAFGNMTGRQSHEPSVVTLVRNRIENIRKDSFKGLSSYVAVSFFDNNVGCLELGAIDNLKSQIVVGNLEDDAETVKRNCSGPNL